MIRVTSIEEGMTYSNAQPLKFDDAYVIPYVWATPHPHCDAPKLKINVLYWHYAILELKEMLNVGENMQSLEKRQKIFQKYEDKNRK